MRLMCRKVPGLANRMVQLALKLYVNQGSIYVSDRVKGMFDIAYVFLLHFSTGKGILGCIS